MEFLAKINDPVLLALASTCFTWFMTALGAGMVFFFKEINKRVLNMMLGRFWSLPLKWRRARPYRRGW